MDAKINKNIQKRWSPRSFQERPVESENLRLIFEAASWAASCFNEQPWRFIFASQQNREQFQAILGCLMKGNQTWAAKAPLLAISVAKTHFEHNNSPNRHAWHDVGQAVATMALQAVEMGIFIHQMAGFDAQKAKNDLNIPEGFEPVAAIAIGYPEKAEVLPEDLRKRELAPRQRQSIGNLLFEGRWGQTVAL